MARGEHRRGARGIGRQFVDVARKGWQNAGGKAVYTSGRAQRRGDGSRARVNALLREERLATPRLLPLLAQFDFAREQLANRLVGLSDDEYL